MKRHSEVVASGQRKNEKRHLTLLGQSATPSITTKNRQSIIAQDFLFKSIKAKNEKIGAIIAVDKVIKRHQILENSFRELMKMQYSNAISVDEGFNFKEEFEPLMREEPIVNKCPILVKQRKNQKQSLCPILSELQNIEGSNKRIAKHEWRRQKDKSAIIKLDPIYFSIESGQAAEESLRDKFLRDEEVLEENAKSFQKKTLPKGDFNHDYDGKQILIAKTTDRKSAVNVEFKYLVKKSCIDRRLLKNRSYIAIGAKSERAKSNDNFRNCMTRGGDLSEIQLALKKSFAHCDRVRIQQKA